MFDMPELTERQKVAWPEAVAEIERYTGKGTVPPLDDWAWTVRWEEEVRPGRGHGISAVLIIEGWWAQICMDVYGYPHTTVSTWDLVHNSFDEDCPCDFCAAERARDDDTESDR